MPGGNCAVAPGQQCESYMGYSVRSIGWRYTEWRAFNRTTGVAIGWGTIPPIATELYQHSAELLGDAPGPGGNESCSWAYEHRNVAADPANAQQLRRLAALLCQGQAPESCPPERS
jgi:hypothetical protein